MKSLVMLFATVMLSFTLGACDREGPAEQAGENIDEFGQEMQHEADEAGDEMEEQYEEMTNDEK